MFFSDTEHGYSRGGVDVVTAVNMFFKFMLLSPIFLLALYITIAMLKHMIFQGIPHMAVPSESQQQRIRDRVERPDEFSSVPDGSVISVPVRPTRRFSNVTTVMVPATPAQR